MGIVSQENIVLPITSNSASFSGVSKRKQGIGVSVGVFEGVGAFVSVAVGVEVCEGVWVAVFVAVEEGVAVGISSSFSLQATKNNPHREVQLIFRKSLLDRFLFLVIISFQ